MPQHTFIHDLGDGLTLRHATPAGPDALMWLNAISNTDIAGNTYDLISWLPALQASDFTIVEETGTEQIVSSDRFHRPVERPEGVCPWVFYTLGC